jgi:hypothetical protein
MTLVRMMWSNRGAARCIGWIALLCCFTIEARSANITAGVDRPVIALGERVTFTLTVEGANISQPSLPAIPNFQIVGQGSSINMNLALGVSQQTFSYQLAPSQVGDYTIPSLQFNVGGQPLRTQPIQIKVLQPNSPATTPGAAPPPAFVKLVTPKTQLYVGEISEVQVQVYYLEARLTQYPQLPVDSGFTVGKWNKPMETRVNLSNRLYGLVVFKQSITPVKAGALALGPATVPVLVPDTTRQPDFFGRRPERELRLATEKVIVQVLPIPEQNAPPTFAGAVGNFTFAVTATPTNLAVGDPITLRVKITGRGALDAIQLPPQPDWSEFKTYPPNSQIEGADPNNNTGTKSFEQVVVPERVGLKVLPPFSFSFFDPEQKVFRTLTSQAFPINVAAGGSMAAMPSLPGGSNAAPAQPASDLAHIKPYLGAAAPGPLLLARPWFLGVQVVPPAVWLGLLLWRKQRERLANDPKLRREREVAQKIRVGLAELREDAAAEHSDAFFATVMRLLQEQIGERVDAPPNAITEAIVEERLRPSGASRELCNSVNALFQRCNQARYAPVKSSEELAAVIPRLEQTLRDLEQWEPKNA